jgi:hypothetical protein
VRWTTRRLSSQLRRGWATGLGVVLGALVDVSPVGQPLLDRVWTAALVGLAAYLATSAKRGPLLAAALLAVVSARSGPALACAVVAVAAGSLSTRRLHRRATFVRGVCGAAALAGALFASHDHSPVVSGLLLVVVGGSIAASGARRATPRARKVLRRTAIGFATLAVVGATAAGLGAAQSMRTVDHGASALRVGLSAARQSDAVVAEQALSLAAGDFETAHRRVDRWGILGRAIPGVAQHVSTLSGVLDTGALAAEQAARTARSADVDALEVRVGRIDPAAVSALANPFHRLVSALGDMLHEVDDHQSSLLLPPLTRRLDDLRGSVAHAHHDAMVAAEAADALPNLLGGDGPKHYLVLFTSPSEARGRFGFPGSFAEVRFEDGRFRLGEHGTTSAVFDQLADPDLAGLDVNDQLRPYLSYGAAREMRSTTIVPDFPTAARAAARIWEQGGRTPLDGVARFDPVSLAQLMSLTGPVTVRSVPQPLDSTNLEQFVNVDQYLQFPDDVAPRREVLDTVAEETFQRLETANLPGPRRLADLFGPLVRAGHLQIESFDRPGQAFFHRTSLDGPFRPGPSDSLLVTNVNSTGNKIDSLLERAVTYDATVNRRGQLDGTVGITLHNRAPAQGLPLYVIGSFTQPPLPKGTNRTTLIVYTAVPVVDASVDGRPVRVRSQRTAGRWMHELLLELPPGGEQRVRLHVQGEVPRDDGRYLLRVDPGGGASPDPVHIAVAVAGHPSISHEGDLRAPLTLG